MRRGGEEGKGEREEERKRGRGRGGVESKGDSVRRARGQENTRGIQRVTVSEAVGSLPARGIFVRYGMVFHVSGAE